MARRLSLSCSTVKPSGSSIPEPMGHLDHLVHIAHLVQLVHLVCLATGCMCPNEPSEANELIIWFSQFIWLKVVCVRLLDLVACMHNMYPNEPSEPNGPTHLVQFIFLATGFISEYVSQMTRLSLA